MPEVLATAHQIEAIITYVGTCAEMRTEILLYRNGSSCLLSGYERRRLVETAHPAYWIELTAACRRSWPELPLKRFDIASQVVDAFRRDDLAAAWPVRLGVFF